MRFPLLPHFSGVPGLMELSSLADVELEEIEELCSRDYEDDYPSIESLLLEADPI